LDIREIHNMKKGTKIGIVIILVVISISACGKRIVPSSVTGKNGKHFDASAFNYIYVEAIKQKLMGNITDALSYLEQCIKMNPNSDASYYQMAQIVLNNGDINTGKKYVKMAVSLEEKNVWYLMMLAGIYYQEKNLDSAIFCYEKAIRFRPGEKNLMFTLGSLYSEDNKFARANEIFESMDQKFGISENSALATIRNLLKEKKYDKAEIKLRLLLKEKPDEVIYNGLLAEVYRGKGQDDEALKVYNALIERNPDNPQTQLSLCDFLISEKRFDELLNLLNTVILNTGITREDKVSLLAKLIEVQDVIKNYSNKLILSLMVMEANYRSDIVVPLLRPELLIKIEKFDDAEHRLEELVKENPDNYFAREKLLLLYLQLKDYNKLMVQGEDCATRFNRSFLAKVLYANGAIECGKFEVAIEELRNSEILAGDNIDLITQVLTLRAELYYRMKEYTKAFEIFDEAVKSAPDDVTILNNYAYYLAEQDTRLKEAENMARIVIMKEKENTTYLDTYAWVLYKRGRLKEAAGIMEKIIAGGDVQDAVWFEHLGYILKAQKKCSAAIYNWNTALKIDSSKTGLIKEIKDCER
jgi:predicted Zn-dependent protease